jgi:hypothetical protein
MVYVRRNESTSIGKVRTSDVDALLRAPAAYRDRTVLNIAEEDVEKLTLATQNKYVGGKNSMTFEKGDEAWKMTAPVEAAVRTDRLEMLVASAATLRAAAIAADGGEASAFGLHEPAATLTLTHTTAPDDDAEPPQPAVAATVQLSLAAHDGKFYAKRSDRPAIYEVAADFYNQLLQEFRTTDVLSFDQSQVKEFSIRKGEQTHTFVKKESKWTYHAEPDLPLDPKKVDNLLLQLKDLKTERYVRNAADDLAAFGLSASLLEVTVTLEDGAKRTLRVSAQGNDKEADKGKYAVVNDGRDVFLLTEDTLKRIEVSLPELEKA